MFTPGFVFLVGSVLPFARTCVHSRFCFLGGICLSLLEDLCSLQVLFSWWGLSYPSRRPVLTPGFVYLVGSVLPFPRICVHSRFCFLVGSVLPVPKTCVHSRFCLLGEVCRTLPEDLCSLQVLFSWWVLFCSSL